MVLLSKISILIIAVAMFLVVTTQAAIAATTVEVTDSSSTLSCGNLISMGVSPGITMQLAVDGNCLGSIGGTDTPQVVDHTPVSLDEGNAVYIQLTDGAIVQLPVNSSLTMIQSNPKLGHVVLSHDENVAFYYAPPPGTIATPTASDEFTYKITDATGASDTGRVIINIIAVSP